MNLRSFAKVCRPGYMLGCLLLLGSIANGDEPMPKKSSDRPDWDIIVQQRRVKQRLTSVLDEKLGRQIEKVPGVVAATPGLVNFIALEELGIDAVVVQAWPADSPLMKKLNIVTGRSLKKDDAGCILLGETLAAALDKKVGDKVLIENKTTCTVVGTFKSPVVYESQSIVMLLPDLQDIMDRKNRVTGFAVTVEHPDKKAEVARIIKAINAIDPKIEAQPKPQLPKETEKPQSTR